MSATPSHEATGGNSAHSLHRLVIQPGVRVLITGNHPWTGHSGVVEERIVTLVGGMWRVNLDNGINAGVDDGNLKAV